MNRHKLYGLCASLMVLVLVSCKPGNSEQGGRLDVSGACNYLWSQQHKDGAWRSTQHRIMGEGHALTPFVLYHMDLMPDSLKTAYKSKFVLGLNYLRQQLDQYGILGFADPDLMEYPNYANAYALMVLYGQGDPLDSVRIKRLQHYLADQQFVEHRGFTKEDLAYGGWGFGERLNYGAHGQVDLSHTRRVLKALAYSNYPMEQLKPTVWRFLDVLQKGSAHQPTAPASIQHSLPYDGGFYYSPIVLGANKAHTDSLGVYQSYPTASCDGLLALSLLDASDHRIKDVLNYLNTQNDFWSWGIPGAEHWQQAMTYYYLMVRSEVRLNTGHQTFWDPQVLSWLGQQQLANGSFQNSQGAISKEDEPILTTTMALYTWLNCQLADKN